MFKLHREKEENDMVADPHPYRKLEQGVLGHCEKQLASLIGGKDLARNIINGSQKIEEIII